MEAISGKVNEKVLGIYTEYAGNEKSDYTIVTACETDGKETIPEGTVIVTIPAGKYAKFVAKGDLHEAVAECWKEIWNTDLVRSFECDFEEYQDGAWMRLRFIFTWVEVIRSELFTKFNGVFAES